MKITLSPSVGNTALLEKGVKIFDNLYRKSRCGADVFQLDTNNGHTVFIRVPVDRIDDCWVELASKRDDIGKGTNSVIIVYDWLHPHDSWSLEDRTRWHMPQDLGTFNGDLTVLSRLSTPRRNAMYAFLEAASE